MKEFVVKVCKRCAASWYGDSSRTVLEHGDQLTIITMRIPFCDLCKEAHEQETNAPTYHRVPRQQRR